MAPNRAILIVEDDLAIRESLRELLDAEGYSVFLADNGQRALELIAQSPEIALILLDLSMPIMDGPTFLREFAAKYPERAGLPILIMTAAGRSDIPAHPATLVLRKPLDVDLLMETLLRLLT